MFAAVAAENGGLLEVELTVMGRYEPDGGITTVAAWTGTGGAAPVPVGTRTSLGGRNVSSLVFQTGRPTRLDDYADASGPHARATVIDVEVAAGDRALSICVRDDGRGGADVTGGSGLVGLVDRVEALSGRISLHSPPGGGTRLETELPLDAARLGRPFGSGGHS